MAKGMGAPKGKKSKTRSGKVGTSGARRKYLDSASRKLEAYRARKAKKAGAKVPASATRSSGG